MASGYRGDAGDGANVIRLDVPGRISPRAPVILAASADFSIGSLRVSPALRQLTYQDGGRESLEPRVMEVFVALYRADGVTVSRDDLMAACWRGTFVGEDAIQRTIQRLRRVADRSRAFRIETVTKVGYRIEPVDAPAVDSSAERGEGASGSGAGRSRWLTVAGALMLLVLCAVAGWWLLQPRPLIRERSLALLPARASNDVPRALVDAVQLRLQAALGRFGTPGSLRLDDLVARTTLVRAGAGYTLAIAFEDRASGTVLWTGSRPLPAADPAAALTPITRDLAYVLDCGKTGVEAAPPSTAPKILSLYLQYCEARAGKGAPSRRLQLGNEMTAAAPAFPLGWLVVAEGEAAAMMRTPLAEEPKHRSAGLAAVQRFNVLMPGTSDGNAYAGLLADYRRPIEREALLRQASSQTFVRCRCALEFLDDFLLQSGRGADALPFVRRALDQNSGDRIAYWRAFMTARLAGRTAEAAEAYGQILALSADGGDGVAKQLSLYHALWSRDWRTALEKFDSMRGEPDPHQRAVRAAFAALAANQPTEMALAAQALEALPEPLRDDNQDVPLLAQLGAIDTVLARLERSRVAGGDYAGPGRRAGRAQPLVFDPLLRPAYSDPRFADFLERAGFMAYWRQSHSRPDLCMQADAPPFCRRI